MVKKPSVSVSPSIAASPAVHVSVLMVDGQTGELPLQFTKPRLSCQIGAQQQTTQNVSDGDEGGSKKSVNSGVLCGILHQFKWFFKVKCCACALKIQLYEVTVFTHCLLHCTHP